MYSFKKAGAAIVIAGMLAPAAVFAQTASTTASSSAQSQLDQLKALQAQMQSLQTQQEQVMAQLLSTLKQGNRGEQVKILQQMLMMDPSLFPGGSVTGFYGKQTAEAVKRFQKKHGIEQAGTVGPKTLKKLNEMFAKMGTSTTGRDDSDRGPRSRDYRDDDRGRGENRGRGGDDDRKITICHKGQTLSVDESAYRAHASHGDTRGPCSATTTPPVTDTIAPVISATAVRPATTTATISWTTNEIATGKVYFGTTNPLALMTASTVSTSTLSTAHTFTLSGLSASTTYYFVLESKDGAQNTVTSPQALFTTTN